MAFNNYATFVKLEIMFWTYGIARFMAEYCIMLETQFEEDYATHKEKWDLENRKKTRFGAILASSPLKDSFRGLSPEIYRDNS